MKIQFVTILLLLSVICRSNAQEQRTTRITDNSIIPSDSTQLIKDTLKFDSLPVDSALVRAKQRAIRRLSEQAKEDSIRSTLPIYGWKVSPKLGERTFVEIDTSLIDFHQSTLVDGKDVAVSYLGNVGSPAQTKIFFNRPETSRFIFQDVLSYWRKRPEDHIFLNTKVPYSNIFYQESGGKRVAENRFTGTMASNFGKKFNIGFDFDYIYSRGFYTSLSNKQMSYDIFSSYIGDKYSMQFFCGFNNYSGIENGGIKDARYITTPNLDGLRFSGNSMDIPTRLSNTRNKLRGHFFYLNHKYNLGNETEMVRINDSTVVERLKKNYIPPASIIFTTYYQDQRRRITSEDIRMDSIFFYDVTFPNKGENPKYSNESINDYMSYYSLKNTLALAMNEGFRSWVKFGLTAYVEYDIRKYSIPWNYPNMQTLDDESAFNIGGILSSEQGKHLKYKALIEKNMLGGDFRLEGQLSTTIKLKGKDISARANAYIKNITPSYFQNHFSSKYWNWNYDFSDTRRVFIGGEIEIPFTRTKISGGVENIQNYIYFGTDGFATQKSGSVQVVSFQLDQKLQTGILHWDNKLVYQMTGDDEVIPLPDLSLYSNLYITSRIAKVLHFQLGADAHYFTKYNVPAYNVLTMQFTNQRETKIGNFPIASVYVNLLLKNTRFFLMYYNVASDMGNAESFTVPYYPVNPRGMRLGLSWKFNN